MLTLAPIRQLFLRTCFSAYKIEIVRLSGCTKYLWGPMRQEVWKCVTNTKTLETKDKSLCTVLAALFTTSGKKKASNAHQLINVWVKCNTTEYHPTIKTEWRTDLLLYRWSWKTSCSKRKARAQEPCLYNSIYVKCQERFICGKSKLVVVNTWEGDLEITANGHKGGEKFLKWDSNGDCNPEVDTLKNKVIGIWIISDF